ncbi:MAG: hypothetical protein U5K72_09200 [Balneolaceae bacterium]|nr:hypothetical protein [Balneolaceae bacterium]
MTLTPEQIARQEIDRRLEQAGWSVQDYKKIDFGAENGKSIRYTEVKFGINKMLN